MVSTNRVTQTSITSNSLRGLQASMNRVQDLQNQLTSGKRLSRPSDDPAGLATTMQLRSQLRQDDRYMQAIGDATDRLTVADTSLQNVSTLLQRAKQLAIKAGSGALEATARDAIASELSVIRSSVIDAFNTSYQGRPVFGGSASSPVAVQSDGTYVGNDAPIQARIARNVSVRVDVKGTDVAADEIPDLLQRLTASVASGDPTALAADQNQLDAVFGKVTTALGDVGARVTQIDNAKNRLTSEQVDLSGRISALEDPDLPEAIMQLSSAQVAYQSALGASAKVMQTSLLDYLK